MYVPEHFELRSLAHQHDVIRTHDFGLIVCPGGPSLDASHLPFELDADAGPLGTLRAHVAKANPIWQRFDGEREALVVFAGPHAYVSPNWYPEGPNLPTWNYVTVHAYGRPVVEHDEAAVRAQLEGLVERHEGRAGWQLETQTPDFLAGMQRGIVAFEIAIDRIEAKAKLAQNHPDAKQRGAIEGLRGQGGEDARAVADWMSRSLDGELD